MSDALDYVLAHRSLTVNGCKYSLISSGCNAAVVAISNKMVAKVFSCGEQSVEWELANGQMANGINDLLPRYLGIQATPDYEFDLLLMERLYPMEARAFSIEERKAMGVRFLEQLKELHDGGFCHGDLKRPVAHGMWDNVLLTQDGIRLIDTGYSIDDTIPEFQDEIMNEWQQALEYIQWLIAQP